MGLLRQFLILEILGVCLVKVVIVYLLFLIIMAALGVNYLSGVSYLDNNLHTILTVLRR